MLFSVFQHGHFCINNSYMYMMERESWPHVQLLLCFMFIIMSNACHCFMLCFNYMLLIVGQKLLKACVVLLLTCRLKINIYLSIYLSKSEEIRKRPNLLKFTYIFQLTYMVHYKQRENWNYLAKENITLSALSVRCRFTMCPSYPDAILFSGGVTCPWLGSVVIIRFLSVFQNSVLKRL